MDCRLPGSSVHGIFQARHWSGLPFPSPGHLLNPGIKPGSPHSWQMLYRLSHQGSTKRLPTRFISLFGQHHTACRTSLPRDGTHAPYIGRVESLPLEHHRSPVNTLVKECSKSSKPGFSNTWTVNSQMFKLVLEKAEEPEIKLPTSAGSSKKQESSKKISVSALLTMPKPLTVWITINCGKFWKRWEYQSTWSASWENYMQVRKQQLELDMEQQTGSK